MRRSPRSSANRREVTIERYFVSRVTKLGGEVRKVRWIGRVGCPDRVVFWPEKVPVNELFGSFFPRHARTDWVELKAQGKKPRPSQVREHLRMQQAGQTIYVVDSFNAVEAYLKEIGRV